MNNPLIFNRYVSKYIQRQNIIEYFLKVSLSLQRTSVIPLIISELPMFSFYAWRKFGEDTKKESVDDPLSRSLYLRKVSLIYNIRYPRR